MEKLNQNLKKFAYFSPGLLTAINETMEEDNFRRETVLLKKGFVNHRVYFIVSGLIKIQGQENGKTVIPYILGEEAFVIATDSFFCGDPTEYEIIALEDTKVVSATREQLLMIGKTHMELENGINKIVASYRKQYEKDNNKLDTMEPDEKYKWFTTEKKQLLGRVKDEDIWVYLKMSRNAYYACKNGKLKGKG